MPVPGSIMAVAQSASIRGNIEVNVARHAGFAEAAVEHGARIIIFPELSLTGYEPDIAATHTLTPDDSRLRPLADITDRLGITIVAGAPYRSAERLHIAAFVFQPGRSRIYTKHHLHHGEEAYFNPGMTGLQIGLGGERVSFAICADTTHPSHAEAAAAAGATVYAAGVFITPTGIEADSAQLRGYAKKHRMVVLMANYASPSGGFPTAGKSAIWNEKGETIIQASGVGEVLLLAYREGAAIRGKLITP